MFAFYTDRKKYIRSATILVYDSFDFFLIFFLRIPTRKVMHKQLSWNKKKNKVHKKKDVLRIHYML